MIQESIKANANKDSIKFISKNNEGITNYNFLNKKRKKFISTRDKN